MTLHGRAVDDLPLLQNLGQGIVIDAAWIAQHQAGAQGHERRVDVAAVVDIFEEVNPISFAQDRLQPLPPQFVARAADQVDQVPAQTQDVCRIESRFIVAWRGLVQIDLEQRVQEHGLGRAVPLCA